MPRVKAGLRPWLRLYACGGVKARLFVLEGTALPIDGVLRHRGYRILFATEVVSVLRQADGGHPEQFHLSTLVPRTSDVPCRFARPNLWNGITSLEVDLATQNKSALLRSVSPNSSLHIPEGGKNVSLQR